MLLSINDGINSPVNVFVVYDNFGTDFFSVRNSLTSTSGAKENFFILFYFFI